LIAIQRLARPNCFRRDARSNCLTTLGTKWPAQSLNMLICFAWGHFLPFDNDPPGLICYAGPPESCSSSTGMPCGVCLKASAHASLRANRLAGSDNSFATTKRSRAASQQW